MTSYVKSNCTYALAYHWGNILNMDVYLCLYVFSVNWALWEDRKSTPMFVSGWGSVNIAQKHEWIMTCAWILVYVACLHVQPPLAAAGTGIHDGWKEGAILTPIRNMSNGDVFGSLGREVCNDGLLLTVHDKWEIQALVLISCFSIYAVRDVLFERVGSPGDVDEFSALPFPCKVPVVKKSKPQRSFTPMEALHQEGRQIALGE